MNKGTLKKWNEDRGFGFILPDNGKRDVFIHISTLKNMSRRPIVGDVIFYQIHTDSDGKNRAINSRIEGVTTIKPQVKRNTTTKHRYDPNPLPKLLFLGLLIFAGFFFYHNLFDKNNPSSVINSPVISIYECDGRQHCSQMNSRAEAVFFIRNCPNTKMDGDHDGKPCENDSRF